MGQTYIFFGYINFKWTEYRIETKYSMYWKFPRRTNRQKGWKLKNFFCNELSKYIRGEIIYKIMMIKEYDLSIISWNGHFVKSSVCKVLHLKSLTRLRDFSLKSHETFKTFETFETWKFQQKCSLNSTQTTIYYINSKLY